MRFSLVDRITSLEAGKSIAAVKNLSLAEEYLADHFPGFPVMPGVLMVESLVQASAWLMRHTEDFRYSTVLLKEARAAKFNSFVSPGEALHVTATVHQRGESEWVLKAAGNVAGRSTVSARLTLQQFNLADRNPALAATDRSLTAKMREMFAQLWKPEPAAAS
ncbi:MAG: 3-hydroxyacyl-ACP dehydratase FabZ family protein [Planctomycetales bacterium]